MKNVNNKYAIEFAEAGKYKISCRRWPKECPGPILGIPPVNPKNQFDYEAISPEKVRIKLLGHVYENEIGPKEESVDFIVEAPAGSTILQTDFIEGEETYGVYYTYIQLEGNFQKKCVIDY